MKVVKSRCGALGKMCGQAGGRTYGKENEETKRRKIACSVRLAERSSGEEGTSAGLVSWVGARGFLLD